MSASAEIDHRQLGVDLFDHVWTLLDNKDRTPDENDLMVHAAHASAWHWRQVGEPLNFARSEWQVSHVYAVLERAEPALHHAHRSLEICKANGIKDFDLAVAYEALARASSVAGDRAGRDRWVDEGRKAGEKITKKDDREYFFSQLATVD